MLYESTSILLKQELNLCTNDYIQVAGKEKEKKKAHKRSGHSYLCKSLNDSLENLSIEKLLTVTTSHTRTFTRIHFHFHL